LEELRTFCANLPSFLFLSFVFDDFAFAVLSEDIEIFASHSKTKCECSLVVWLTLAVLFVASILEKDGWEGLQAAKMKEIL
jgi:hypothetical protein